jgi:hypothetical protein
MPVDAHPIVRIDPAHRQRTAQTQVESTASALLTNTPYQSLSKIDCRFGNGLLTLRGRVESYFLKQVAQERLLKNLDPSIRISNQLEVI